MPTVSNTAAQQLLVQMLLAELAASGIRVYAMHEEPPLGDADQSGDTPDTPITRWCRVANVVLGDMPNGTGRDEAHQASVAITVTVGVADTANTALRIHQDTDAVAHALNRNSAAITGHRLMIARARGDVFPAGTAPEGHADQRIGVVTATGVLTATA